MIYLILNEKRQICKIGFTTDVKRRIASLKNLANEDLALVYSIEGDMKFKKEVHLKFKYRRIFGEWFEYCDEITKFFQERLELDKQSSSEEYEEITPDEDTKQTISLKLNYKGEIYESEYYTNNIQDVSGVLVSITESFKGKKKPA